METNIGDGELHLLIRIALFQEVNKTLYQNFQSSSREWRIDSNLLGRGVLSFSPSFRKSVKEKNGLSGEVARFQDYFSMLVKTPVSINAHLNRCQMDKGNLKEVSYNILCFCSNLWCSQCFQGFQNSSCSSWSDKVNPNTPDKSESYCNRSHETGSFLNVFERQVE